MCIRNRVYTLKEIGVRNVEKVTPHNELVLICLLQKEVWNSPAGSKVMARKRFFR